jgi:hypothetical protein
MKLKQCDFHINAETRDWSTQLFNVETCVSLVVNVGGEGGRNYYANKMLGTK